jgi:hypothetical protein
MQCRGIDDVVIAWGKSLTGRQALNVWQKSFWLRTAWKKVECGGQIDVDRKTSGCTIEDLD